MRFTSFCSHKRPIACVLGVLGAARAISTALRSEVSGFLTGDPTNISIVFSTVLHRAPDRAWFRQEFGPRLAIARQIRGEPQRAHLGENKRDAEGAEKGAVSSWNCRLRRPGHEPGRHPRATPTSRLTMALHFPRAGPCDLALSSPLRPNVSAAPETGAALRSANGRWEIGRGAPAHRARRQALVRRPDSALRDKGRLFAAAPSSLARIIGDSRRRSVRIRGGALAHPCARPCTLTRKSHRTHCSCQLLALPPGSRDANHLR